MSSGSFSLFLIISQYLPSLSRFFPLTFALILSVRVKYSQVYHLKHSHLTTDCVWRGSMCLICQLTKWHKWSICFNSLTLSILNKRHVTFIGGQVFYPGQGEIKDCAPKCDQFWEEVVNWNDVRDVSKIYQQWAYFGCKTVEVVINSNDIPQWVLVSSVVVMLKRQT